MRTDDHAWRRGFALARWGILSALVVGCSDASFVEANAVQEKTHALSLPGASDEALQNTLAPVRPPPSEADGASGVYMKSVDEKIGRTGTFSQVFHVYQPNSDGESLQFDVSAVTENGSVDTRHEFRSVKLTLPNGTGQTLANGKGQYVYTTATSSKGWYRLEFRYYAPNPNRTLRLRATDSRGNSLKIGWSDPPSADVQVSATVTVTKSTSSAYLKGGAYRNTNPSEYAYADNVTVDGQLLYRRGFDQGQFNFPLGQLSAGDHTVQFSLTASGYSPAKFWFGVNDKSFDPAGVKKTWDPAQILYWGAMHTGDYDAWNEGVAFAQDAAGGRTPPVRRGTTFAVAIENTALNGAQQNAKIAIASDTLGNMTWPQVRDYDYAGGTFANGVISTSYREHWRITVPSDAPIGRYRLVVESPTGDLIGDVVPFYVIHNPYLIPSNQITKEELETYGYDEDEDGVHLGGNFGTDEDHSRDHFIGHYDHFATKARISGAFRRTVSSKQVAMLDLAVAAAQDTTSELETMRRLYRLIAQRYVYNMSHVETDVSAEVVDGLTPYEASIYSRPGTTDPIQRGGQCYDYAAALTAIARSVGILSRAVGSTGTLSGWGNHMFTEAYIPTAPESDRWYVFDATDPFGTHSGTFATGWPVYSEGLGPRAPFAEAAFVLLGQKMGNSAPRTTPVDWDPFAFTSEGALFLDSYYAAAFQPGAGVWLTSGGATGILGRGDKDVYRVNKAATGATEISVHLVEGGGDSLTPVLCIGDYVDPNEAPLTEGDPANGVPPAWRVSMPRRCDQPATTLALPEGNSYVLVFHDHGQPDDDYVYDYLSDRMKYGDTVRYALTLR